MREHRSRLGQPLEVRRGDVGAELEEHDQDEDRAGDEREQLGEQVFVCGESGEGLRRQGEVHAKA